MQKRGYRRKKSAEPAGNAVVNTLFYDKALKYCVPKNYFRFFVFTKLC